MANFTSTITYTDEQIASAPPLEPAFEHLRNSTTQSVISTLRVNGVTDRETFDKMFDSETALKEGTSDLGFNLTSGGLPLKREFARVVTAWKTAKIMAETKLQTNAVARAHGVPVTLLPCDWTSILTEFKKKFCSHIADDRQPAQSMFEHFMEKLGERRHLSTEPTNKKGLKYSVLTNLWLLAQIGQPTKILIVLPSPIFWTPCSIEKTSTFTKKMKANH